MTEFSTTYEDRKEMGGNSRRVIKETNQTKTLIIDSVMIYFTATLGTFKTKKTGHVKHTHHFLSSTRK